MKELILFANEYPYGKWEPYLKNELEYLADFDKVTICSLQIRKEDFSEVRSLPRNDWKVIPVMKKSGIVYILYALVALFDKNIYTEIVKLVKQKRLSLGRLKRLFIFVSRAHYEANKLIKELKKDKTHADTGVLYSYRFEYQPYVALLVKKHFKNFKVICRAHGYDLFEERNCDKYIPLREYILENIDFSFQTSDITRNYLCDKFPAYSDKILVKRMGTCDHGIKQTELNGETLNIVSCSAMVEVKRIDLIVKALMHIRDIKIHWTHYGDGALENSIKSLCEDLDPDRISCEFRGYVTNEQILSEYAQKDYHLFVNVSSSEGVPISIMEALSFSIPCVATDVGGVAEIIEDKKNGFLLDKDFDVKELADLLQHIAKMNSQEYNELRLKARSSWQEKYCEQNNYSSYRDFIFSIL